MDHYDLNREIAQATGESTETIEAMGFSLWTPAPPSHTPRPLPCRILRPPNRPTVNRKPRPRDPVTRARRIRFVPKAESVDLRDPKVLTMDFDRPEGA